jgi:hypothetical protein
VGTVENGQADLTLYVPCPTCRVKLLFRREQAGRRLTCPRCGETVRGGLPPEPPPKPPALPTAPPVRQVPPAAGADGIGISHPMLDAMWADRLEAQRWAAAAEEARRKQAAEFQKLCRMITPVLGVIIVAGALAGIIASLAGP